VSRGICRSGCVEACKPGPSGQCFPFSDLACNLRPRCKQNSAREVPSTHGIHPENNAHLCSVAMSPFSSLGVAADVVEFLEFGYNLVSGTYEIYRSHNGLADELSELSKRTERVGILASGLAAHSHAPGHSDDSGPSKHRSSRSTEKREPNNPEISSPAPHAVNDTNVLNTEIQYRPEQAYQNLTRLAASLQSCTAAISTSTHIRRSAKEEALVALASSCKTTADTLCQAITKISIDGKKFKAFGSFRQALQKEWGSRKLKTLESTLEKQRSDLALHLVAIIKYAEPRTNWRRRIRAVADSARCSDTQSGVVRDLQALRDANISLEVTHGKQLDDIGHSLKWIEDNAKSTLDAHVKHPSQEPASYLVEILKVLPSTAGAIAREQAILRGLHFKAMKARQENIAETYANTFKWMFSSESPGQPAKHVQIHLVEWLSREDGFFWISGKPGSGKSTLMKYLCDHTKTRDALSTWAQPNTPIVSTHFFWCSGTPLQKSQEGLLRSLLYDVFKQCPEIVRKVCPDRWEAAAQPGHEQDTWTLSELRQALQRLCLCCDMGVKFCFFIDGLDEYDGDHSEIIKSLALLAESRVLKFCISSRSWNVFEDAYGKDCARKLYMQDLTRDDINYYVESKLKEHTNWAALASDMETGQYQNLVSEIANKAQGVFLWIYLVVRSLHEGLTNGDSISTLQRRIRTMPADLEPFFKHMLDSIDPVYRQAMVHTFQIAINSPKPLPLIVYHFISEEFEKEGFSVQHVIRPFGSGEIALYHERTRRQLNGRCKGLLEVHKDDSEGTHLGFQVDFLHRTVRDFLRTKEMDDYLTPEHGIGGSSAVTLKGFAVLLKTLPLDKLDMSDGGSLSRLLADAFYFAYHAELESGKAETDLLDDIGNTLRLHSSTTGKCIPWYAGCYESHRKDCHSRCKTYFEFTIQKGLSLYVQDKLKRASWSVGIQTPLLHSALGLVPPTGSFKSDLTPVVRLLLDAGHEPNRRIKWVFKDTGETPWSSFLTQWAIELQVPGSDCQSRSTAAIRHKRSLVELLLSRGTDPNVRDARGYTAWYILLLASAQYPFPMTAISDIVKVFEAFFRAGADVVVSHSITGPSPHAGRNWLSRLHLVGTSGANNVLVSASDRQAKFEFLSKIFCLLLKHGVSPEGLEDSKISNMFPSRLALPVLDLLAERRQVEIAAIRDAARESPQNTVSRYTAISWAKSAVGVVRDWVP